jgi:outer membrane protein TolC
MEMRSFILICLIIGALYRASGQTSVAALNAEQELKHVTAVLQNEEILDSLSSLAVRNSNLLKAIDQEILMYEEEVLQKRRLWLTSFRFGVNLFSANTQLDENNQSITTYGVLPTLGLNMTVDPEKLVNRKSYIRQSRTKQEYSRYIQLETMQDIKKEVRNMYYDYLVLLEAINIRRNALDIREQQEQYVENQVKIGESTYDLLLIASNQVHLAEEALVRVTIDAKKKKDEISVYIGLK